MRRDFDAIVIGAGLGGLTAATFLAREGMSVGILEKANHPGGRAITEQESGFKMNLGPHALYKSGEAIKILRELNLDFSGKSPSGRYGSVIHEGNIHRLPYDAVSLMTTSLMSWHSKWELFRFLAALPKMKTEDVQGQTLRNWLWEKFRTQEARDFIALITRVATYTNDLDSLSAGAALQQLQIAASGNVLYLDGGWQVLVNGLRKAAEQAGATFLMQSKVVELDYDSAVRGVLLSNGRYCSTRQAILAISPAEVAELLKDRSAPVRKRLRDLVPVKMASLTVGVKRLPEPRTLLAFGMDQPLYFSVHSNWAKLTEVEGSALIHAGKYLPPGKDTNPEQDQKELEEMLDLIQTGWRNEVVVYSFLPRMKVSNNIVTAAGNGLRGRPGMDLINVQGLYVCGDWVGERGMLCDASLISARAAARRILSEKGWNKEPFEVVRSA